MIEGFEPKYFHKVLSDFWLDYEQKDWMNKYWESLCQVMDEEYLELYQANFSKSILYCPVYTRRLWLNYQFEESDWKLNRKPHSHKYHSISGFTGTTINLPFEVEPRNILVFQNQSLIQYSRDYLMPDNTTIELNSAAASDDFFVDYIDFNNSWKHSHKIFQETLLSNKSEWTIPFLDPPSGYGAYDPNVTMKLFVDGDFWPSSRYSLDFVTAKLTIDPAYAPILAGSHVMIIWVHSEFKEFEETLAAPKQIWSTEVFGDQPEGFGPYDSNASGLQFEVNGVPKADSFYEMTDETTLETTAPVAAGSDIRITWNNPTNADDIHTHLRGITYYPSGSDSIEVDPIDLSNNEKLVERFRFNRSDDYEIDKKRDLVWVGGTLAKKDEEFESPPTAETGDYKVNGNEIELRVPLASDSAIVVDVIDPGIQYYAEIDPSIVRIPKLQDGIDEYDNEWFEFDDYEIKNGRILSETKFENVWAFESYINEEVPYKNFGEPIDFYRENDDTYLGMVQALWRAYWSGPRIHITEEACKMLFNIPFVITPGRIKNITDSGAIEKDYQIEFENGAVYDLNYPLVPRFEEGDYVEAYETLAGGVDIYDAVKNPNWYKLFPPFLEFLNEFYYNEEDLPYAGCFDDGLYFDDDGRFDYFDYRFDPEDWQDIYKERLYEVLKHFVFLVDVDIDIIPDASYLDDVTTFLDRIKPAYTMYIIITTKNASDEIDSPGESFEMEAELDIEDHHPAPFDDFKYGVIVYTVEDKGLATPPSSPSIGEMHIVGSGTGDWSGHDDEIATWNGDYWIFTSPYDGLGVYVSAESKRYVYNGSSWLSCEAGDNIRDPYFDDSGYFDTENEPHTETATAGQSSISIPYNSYQDDWVLRIDGVVQTEGVDWDWNDDTSLQMDLTSALSGGEEIMAYRDDGDFIPLDWRTFGDYVEFELIETVSAIAHYTFNV